MDIELALMAGIDLPVPECQLIIHQPSLSELALMGETDFFIGIQCLCIQKTMCIEDKSLLDNTSNFQVFMTVMNDQHTTDKRNIVLQTLSLLFPSYKTNLTPQSLFFFKDQETIMIDENNFNYLQKILERMFCLSSSDQASFNPANSQAKKIADKIMRGRQRVAQQKSGENSGSIFSRYVSILTVGLKSMSLLECLKLTVYQIQDLVERLNLYLAWDADLKCRLAGGKPDKQPEDWMKNLH